MFRKAVKLLFLAVLATGVTGYYLFGRDLPRFAYSVTHVLGRTMRDNISFDFQISRAREQLEEIQRQMQGNQRLIDDQQTAIVNLQSEIQQSTKALADEKGRVERQRDDLAGGQSSFAYGDISYSRAELAHELSRRFEDYKESETALAEKRMLLLERQHALAAATAAMDRANAQEATLKNQIDWLQNRYQMAQESSDGGEGQIDAGKLNQGERTVEDLRHEMDASRHMLADQAKLDHPAASGGVDDKALIAAINAHMAGQVASK